MFTSLGSLQTPCLVVDKIAFLHNLSRMEKHLDAFNVALRPHLKTVKSTAAANYILADKQAGCTVSTLKEAETFAAEGYTNITYAVGITEDKLQRVLVLINQGVNLTILLDSMEQAMFVSQFCAENGCKISCLIEIDCDGHRAGLSPKNKEIVTIATILESVVISGLAYTCRRLIRL